MATQDSVVTVGLLTPFLAVIGIMFRVLLKPDARWEGLIEEQRKQHQETKAELDAMRADRDYWRNRVINPER